VTVEVLATDTAHRRFGPRLAQHAVTWLRMTVDGSLLDEAGAPVAWEEAHPEIAWGTSDLFLPGGPVRPFFSLLPRIPDLAWFASPAAGYDAPVFATLASRGTRVTNAHVNSVPIAEFVLRAVLDEFQQAGRWRDQRAERSWATHDWREVAGSTWLVVGLGSIGREVAVRARAFGATVIGCRRHPAPDDPADRLVTPDRLDEVVPQADVIVLCAPANASTDHLVDAPFLARMAEGAVLVNVGRGSLVDEEALLASLDRGRPALAILDVFAVEPLPTDHQFWSHPSVRVTPHNAAGGSGRLARQAELFATNLTRYRGGEPLLHDVTERILADHGGRP
jgi:phosphoglycerate dehydrogenase-like enzyme